MSSANQQKPVYRFGEFTLDTAHGVVLRHGQDVGLRPQSVSVLQVLIESHGQVVSREALHDSVWGRKAVTDDSLAQCIADIRRALGDADRKLVRTLPRRGYVFDAAVALEQPGTEKARGPSSPGIRTVTLVAAFLLIGWLSWSYWSIPDKSPSIAVLPLINMSAVPENEFFSEGVHEEILTNLARVENLRVISRTTMLQYLDMSRSSRAIARELDVEYIVEGSVRRIGNHVRITVQLVDALEDSHLWARNYDRELRDVFGTQTEVARDISNSIQLEIMPASVGTLERMPTESVRAYDLFIRADGIHRGEAIAEDAYRRQRALLEAAVEEDSEFVEAWARLNEHLDEMARTIVQDGWFGETQEERDAYFAETRQAAQRALDRAVALDPDSVETLIAMGTDAITEFEDLEFRVERRQYLDRALELDPENAWAWYALGWWGWDAGNLEEGTAAMHKALELDPLHAHIVGGSLNYFALIGDREMAALLEDRYAVIAPDTSDASIFNGMPGGLARMPSDVRLMNLYNLFIYTGEELMIDTLAESYAVEAEDFIVPERAPNTLEFWNAKLLVLRNDVDALLQLEGPRTPDGASFRQVMHDIALHNILLGAQLVAGRSGAADSIARRILDLHGQLDVDPASDEGFQAATSIATAIKTLGDEEQARDMRDYLREHNRFPEQTQDPWPLFAYSNFDPDGAVAMLLAYEAEHPEWHGPDVIAAGHIVFRDLLCHPDMQAFYVSDGKWLDYLAARVPEYARFVRTDD